MDYEIKNNTYIANDGYVFQNKANNNTYKGLKLGINDSIDNYETIKEEEVIDYEENKLEENI